MINHEYALEYPFVINYNAHRFFHFLPATIGFASGREEVYFCSFTPCSSEFHR